MPNRNRSNSPPPPYSSTDNLPSYASRPQIVFYRDGPHLSHTSTRVTSAQPMPSQTASLHSIPTSALPTPLATPPLERYQPLYPPPAPQTPPPYPHWLPTPPAPLFIRPLTFAGWPRPRSRVQDLESGRAAPNAGFSDLDTRVPDVALSLADTVSTRSGGESFRSAVSHLSASRLNAGRVGSGHGGRFISSNPTTARGRKRRSGRGCVKKVPWYAWLIIALCVAAAVWFGVVYVLDVIEEGAKDRGSS